MAFGALEDLDGKLELVFFPNTWAEVRHLVAVDQVMLVTGKVKVNEERISLQVNKVQTSFDYHHPVEDQPPWPTTPDPVPTRSADKENDSRPERTLTIPPPPPNFEEDWTLTGPANGRAITPTNGVNKMAQELTNSPATPNSEPGQITVAIDPAGNWQQTIRHTVSLAAEHEGPAILTLVLDGQDLVMALPNRTVALTPELITALETLPGIVSVSTTQG